MTSVPTAERTFYDAVLNDTITGIEAFEVEDFVPCNGTILVVMPPPATETKGGVILPEASRQDHYFARVACVPKDTECPVKPGDWVFFRIGCQKSLRLSDRTDVAVIQYCSGPESDIMGFIPAGIVSERGLDESSELD